MQKHWGWIVGAGLPLLLIGGSPALGCAAEAEQKAQPPAKGEQTTEKAPEASKPATMPKKPAVAKQPAGMTGTVIAYTPESRTVVVDVHQAKETLRIGAQVTDHTTIMKGGQKAAAEALKAGEHVRISYHRSSMGDVATSLDIMPPTKR